MAQEFTPKQLNITPALGREKAEARLTVYSERAENFAVKQAWYLVQHTDVTGRMNGEGAMAYRRLSGYQLAKLVCEIANQNIMGADVTAYMYKFMGISFVVVETAPRYLVINNVFDTDIQEYEDELGVMDFLREVEIEDGNPADFLVQKLAAQNLDYSINGQTWLAEYAPIIVDTAPSTPEAAQAEPVADSELPFAEGMDDSEPVTEEYVYGCVNRPAMYGTVPDGYTRIDNTATVYQWGTVIYDYPLTREQVKDYDLHPASANTRRFQVGDFVDWCGDKCEVIAHLPYNGYITIGFGIVTCDEREWDRDMAAWIEPQGEGVFKIADDSEPETVAGESVADSAAPVISEPVSSSAIPVTGHGRKARKARKSANSRVSSKPMAKVTLPNMERRKSPKTAQPRPVANVIQIAEILRSMGIGKAA